MDDKTHRALVDLLACRPRDINSITLSTLDGPKVLLKERAFRLQFPDAEPFESEFGRAGILYYEVMGEDGILYVFNETLTQREAYIRQRDSLHEAKRDREDAA